MSTAVTVTSEVTWHFVFVQLKIYDDLGTTLEAFKYKIMAS